MEPKTAPTAPVMACSVRKLPNRSFDVDVMTCGQCKGKLLVVATIDSPDAVAAMLRHLGLDPDPNPDPTTTRSEGGPQLEHAFDYGA